LSVHGSWLLRKCEFPLHQDDTRATSLSILIESSLLKGHGDLDYLGISLAICEYIQSKYLDGADAEFGLHEQEARSCSAEITLAFSDSRPIANELPRDRGGKVPLNATLERISSIDQHSGQVPRNRISSVGRVLGVLYCVLHVCSGASRFKTYGINVPRHLQNTCTSFLIIDNGEW